MVEIIAKAILLSEGPQAAAIDFETHNVYFPKKGDGGTYWGRISGNIVAHENTYFVGMAGDLEVWGFPHVNGVPNAPDVFGDGSKALCMIVAEKGGAGPHKRYYNWTYAGVDPDGVIHTCDSDVDMGMNRLVELYALCASHGLLPSPVTSDNNLTAPRAKRG